MVFERVIRTGDSNARVNQGAVREEKSNAEAQRFAERALGSWLRIGRRGK
jgi:hypothetical protein